MAKRCARSVLSEDTKSERSEVSMKISEELGVIIRIQARRGVAQDMPNGLRCSAASV